MKKMFILLSLGIINLTNADCMFKIINYTDSPITAKFGFYNGNSTTLIAKPADTTIQTITSNYECNSPSPSGLGVSYLTFPNDPDQGGVNYSPITKRANLMGVFTGTTDGREVKSDNGTPLWLTVTDLSIKDDVFEVKLNFTGRPNSRSAGTQ